MTINLFPSTGGILTSATTWINNNNAVAYRQAGRNLIRQLLDRSVYFSADGFEWAEAYTDEDGRESSVDTASTTCNYDTLQDVYRPKFTDDSSGDVTHDPDGFTDPSNAFDGDDDTYAEQTTLVSGTAYSLGKTFSSKQVDVAFIKCSGNSRRTGGTGGVRITAKLQTYDGSTWNDFVTLYDDLSTTTDTASGSFTGAVGINDTIQGIRVETTWTNPNPIPSNYVRVYTLEYGDTDSDGVIVHTVPSGTYSSTIAAAFGTGMVVDSTSESSDIQFKLTNGTDDSGWLYVNQVSEFTAFNTEPTSIEVKLPASYVSLSGFAVFE